MLTTEDAMKMKKKYNDDEMKNDNYIYRKNYFLVNESTYVQSVSLSVESIEIIETKVDRTLDVSLSDMKEASLDQLDDEDNEKLKLVNEFIEVYVMPKGVYEDLINDPRLDLFDLPTEYMILLN